MPRARRSSSRRFSSHRTCPAERPRHGSVYSTRPSDSTATAASSNHASTTVTDRPGLRISTCSSGVGRPAPRIRSRPRVSRGDSARPSASATARRAAGAPRQDCWATAVRARSWGVVRPASRAASIATTACSNGHSRAQSTSVRAGEVRRNGPCRTTSSGPSGAQAMRNPEPTHHCSGSVRRTVGSSPPHTGTSRSRAAEPWLTVVPGRSRKRRAARRSAPCRRPPISARRPGSCRGHGAAGPTCRCRTGHGSRRGRSPHGGRRRR